MSVVNNIVKLLKTLTNNEVQILINKYERNGEKSNSLKLKFINIVFNDKILEDKQICSALYGVDSSQSFTQLKHRLYEDVMSVLAYEGGSKTFRSKLFMVKNKVRKYVINSEILFARGFDDLAIAHLKLALKYSSKYELNSDLIIIYELLQRHEGQKKGIGVYKRYGELKAKEIEVLEHKSQAHAVFYEIILHEMSHKSNRSIYINSLTKGLNELENHYLATNSIEILALKLRAGTYYGHLIEKYDLALNYAQQYLHLTCSNHIVSSLSNQAGAHMQMAMIYLYLSKYEYSIFHSKQAADLFPRTSINQLRTAEITFVAYVLAGQINKVDSILDEVKLLPVYNSSNVMGIGWKLREIATKFLNRKFNDSLKMLRTNQASIDSIPGWVIGFKLLELMTLLELELFDWFEPRLKSLKLTLKSKDADPRIFKILKLLSDLERRNYDYRVVINLNSFDLEELEKVNGQFKWDPFGYEVIPFHSWMKSKAIKFDPHKS